MSRSEHGVFMRVASAVGDLGSPFYEEERQRDVWNEASAVGFQSMLWSGMVAATVMIWVGRAAAVPYALGTFALVGLASLVTVAFARRLGVEPAESARLWRPATAVFLLLVAAFVAGLLVSVEGPFGVGLATGAAIGAAAGVLTLVGRVLRRRRGEAPEV